MKVNFNQLDRGYQQHKKEYDATVINVLESGCYILGKYVQKFEKNFAKFCTRKYCVGVNSGLDALVLSFQALGIGFGDEVIVPANTYIASVIGITRNNATPIFVDPDEYYNIDPNKIIKAITKKTKAILPVHLYGQACQMDKIVEIANSYNLYIVEDCAQSHGACFDGKITGSFGDIGCFSFYPTKNLGAFGDAGAIVTDNYDLAEKIKMMRNYGSKIKYQNEIDGINSRMDEIQAAFLDVKLNHYDSIMKERILIAKKYIESIKNSKIILPKKNYKADHIYHLFVVKCENRNELQSYLAAQDIQTQIHYPIPPHLSNCYKDFGYSKQLLPITEKNANQILSLPLFNGLSDNEINYVIDVINGF